MSAAVTVWERGRLDARVGPRQVLFGRMYEDTAIELDAFAPGGRVLCIASAGCTAMKLAPHHEVVAVDINPTQLAYAERRFEGDPGYRGRAEQVMAFLRFFGPIAGWWPSRIRAFLELEETAEQTAYWARHLDTWRFRAGLGALFTVTALRSFYDPRLLDFLPKRLGAVMRGRMARCFARHPNRENPFARALLLGELPEDPPPSEARDIRLVHADVAGFLESEPPASFDGFTLSNVLDGADESYRQRLFLAVKRAARPGAVAVLRSFGNPIDDAAEERAAEDRSMIWGSVRVTPAAEI